MDFRESPGFVSSAQTQVKQGQTKIPRPGYSQHCSLNVSVLWLMYVRDVGHVPSAPVNYRRKSVDIHHSSLAGTF